MNHNQIIFLLSIFILILSLILYIKYNNEYFSRQLFEDDDEDIFANLSEDDIIENVQPTLQERQQRQKDYIQARFKPKCKGRCDCCYEDKTSSDRITACTKKYKKGSREQLECMNVNSKYAFEACKDNFGTGGIFGIGKKCL